MVKITKQMKTSLEGMAKAGVNGAMSFGILYKGWPISLLVMDIDNKAMYRLYKLDKLDLIRTSQDFARLPTIIQKLQAFKFLLTEVTCLIEEVELAKKKGKQIKQSRSLSNMRENNFAHDKRSKKE
jgi:hypothetical protein